MSKSARYYDRPPIKLKRRKAKGPHRLPRGWRWLATGEWVKKGDVVCDPRIKPVVVLYEEAEKGAWKMSKECHPVRRKCGGQISRMD